MNFVKKCVCVFLFSLSMATIFAEYNSFGIPDSSEIRKKLRREWFEGPLFVIRGYGVENCKNSIGIDFQIRSEEQDDVFLVIIAPESEGKVDVRDSSGSHVVKENIYNADGAGSWILVRDKKSGDPILVRYYFAKNSEVFIQFRPNKNSGSKNSTFADLIIYDSYAARAVPLGVPFNKFYTASFAEIQALTKKTLPWNYVIPENFNQKKNEGETYRGNYDETLTMIQIIKDNLKNIVYVDNAIYDESGNPVNLDNGLPRKIKEGQENKISVCSQGFAKWVIDGIVEPLAGSYLKREPLLRETVELNPTSYQGTIAESYNIYSSLDWTRNLAAAAMSVVLKRKVLYENSGVDVTVEPFAAMVTDKGVLNTAGYIKNSGYKVVYLKQLLYVLAATNPDYFYLAAIRQSDLNSKIETKVFNDCAVVFPYFDSTGAFRTVVFYDGKEFSLQDFCDAFSLNKRADAFIHLTRVKSTARYYPQIPEGAE